MAKTGKIIKGIAGFYYVHDGIGRVYECKAKGLFRKQGVKPLVGDNVTLEVLDDNEGLGNIIEILPRKNSLIRPASANVDQALVLFAAREPDPNLNLLDRFLVVMGIQGIPCEICFNKADLDGAEAEHLAELYRQSGAGGQYLYRGRIRRDPADPGRKNNGHGRPLRSRKIIHDEPDQSGRRNGNRQGK